MSGDSSYIAVPPHMQILVGPQGRELCFLFSAYNTWQFFDYLDVYILCGVSCDILFVYQSGHLGEKKSTLDTSNSSVGWAGCGGAHL